MTGPETRPIRLGLGANAGQFAVLVGVSALVGGMVGQERTVLPLLADEVFGLTGFTVALTFLVAFGITKAFTNLAAGGLADRFGRKPVLVAGWVIGLPVPLLLMWAPTWDWIVVANVFLGINQGLTWSTTVIMKIDLVGPARRGFAMGLNEAAGYGAVAVTALLTGLIAAEFGLRPAPFFLGLAYAGLGPWASPACSCGRRAVTWRWSRRAWRVDRRRHGAPSSSGRVSATGRCRPSHRRASSTT